MPERWSRLWFAGTTLCVAVGVAVSVATAANNQAGHFHHPVERAFNTLAFFTVQSNLIVGLGTGLLALKPVRSSVVFGTFRLIGLVAITVTGIVYHVALSQIFDLQGWDAFGNQLVHTVVPLAGVIGWVAFGPRGIITGKMVVASLVFPLAWLTFTLIRGAVVTWYPYPFIDVSRLGYGGAILNCLWVALLLLALAAGARSLDRVLRPR